MDRSVRRWKDEENEETTLNGTEPCGMFGENEKKEFKLGALLDEKRIVILKGKKNKTEVLNTLIDRLAEMPEISSREELAWGIFHRESLISTGIGNGLGTPHFRLPSVDSPCLALAVCPDGITDYHSCDSLPVRIVFMIVVGKSHKTLHVKILSEISRLFSDGRLAAAFLAASDPKTCLEILARAEH